MRIASQRKALVTGGASGLGFEVARCLVREGVAVALLDVDPHRTSAAVDALGGKAISTPADVRSRAEVWEAVERAVVGLGGLDTLVLCAGVIHTKPLLDVTESDWDDTLDVNLKGMFLCCQAAAASLSSSRRGRIVTISSDAGRRGSPMLQAYTASKFGVVGLTESLAAELAPLVTVNCVCPVGVPTTGMGQRLLAWKADRTGLSTAEVASRIARSIPLGRNATEQDIAEAVLFFISDSADFITGVTLDVDGGASLDAIPGSSA